MRIRAENANFRTPTSQRRRAGRCWNPHGWTFPQAPFNRRIGRLTSKRKGEANHVRPASFCVVPFGTRRRHGGVSVATPARATIILADTGAGDGVLACLGEQCVYTPATENPAKAFSGTVEAAINQNGSFIWFAFTLSGGSVKPSSPPAPLPRHVPTT